MNRTEILRVVSGSTVHGLALPSSDDLDLTSIVVEPKEEVIGLGHFEVKVTRDRPSGVRSQPGDTDLVTYSLRHFCRLAMKGNPTILLSLFTPRASILATSRVGEALLALAPAFYSKHAAGAFMGYMRNQLERMQGTRGQKDVNRPELVAQYGFDTKYAMHALRLGLQGSEYLRTGRIVQPIGAFGSGQRLMMVRRGEVPFEECVRWGYDLLADLERAANIPQTEPDRAAVDAFLIKAYEAVWQEEGA